MKKFYVFGMAALLCASLFVLGCGDDDSSGGGGGGGLSDLAGTYTGFFTPGGSLTVEATSLTAGSAVIANVTTAAGGTFSYQTVSYTWVYLVAGDDHIGIALTASGATTKTIALGTSAVSEVAKTYGISPAPADITNDDIIGMGNKY